MHAHKHARKYIIGDAAQSLGQQRSAIGLARIVEAAGLGRLFSSDKHYSPSGEGDMNILYRSRSLLTCGFLPERQNKWNRRKYG